MAISGTVRYSTRRFWRCHSSRASCDEAISAGSRVFTRGGGAFAALASVRRLRVRRAGCGICVSRIVSDARDRVLRERCVASDLALSRVMAARAEARTFWRGPCEEGDFSRPRRARSESGGALDGGRQAAESGAAAGRGLLHAAADHVSGAVAGGLVYVCYGRESGEAQHF